MAAALVLLPQAKTHLRITTTADDADVQMKLDQAEAIILSYLKGANGLAATWTNPANVPPDVVSAILLLLTELFEHRGDDASANEKLWGSIEKILVRYRDPALA
jgi:hypothetical protein